MRKVRKEQQDYRQGVKKMRQYHLYMNKLHQMLRSLGQQQSGNSVIKLDQFQKLRRAFTISAQTYERSNKQIQHMSDRVIRAQLMFTIMENKKIMKDALEQMVKICAKLKQKIQKQQINVNEKHKTPAKNKPRRQFEDQSEVIQDTARKGEDTQNQINTNKSPLQQQLQYKNLTVYNIQKTYFRLVETERKQVKNTRIQIKNNNYRSLDQLRQNAQNRRLINQIQTSGVEEQDNLQQRQLLQAIKQIDDDIERKMDGILQGIHTLHNNALTISQGIDEVHKKIIVNMNIVDQNQTQLDKAQDMLEKVSPYARRPNCICNVVLLFMMALVVFLVVKLFMDENSSSSLTITNQ